MSNKKRYRIRKAQKGEQAGVKNQMQQFMIKAQAGMQQPSPEEMAMMQQQSGEPREINSPQDLQRNSLSQEEAILMKIQELQKLEATPVDIVMYLMQNDVDKQSILGAFDALGMSPDKTEQFIAEVETMLNAKGEGQDMAMSETPEMQEQPPQMKKGGYKKQLIKVAREGREAQTETPGSILPQFSTLNKFINSVKDEGNEFYAKQMTEMTYDGQPGIYKKGGDKKRNRKLAKEISKKEPYERSDRRDLRQGLNSGEFSLEDINKARLEGNSVIKPDDNANYDKLTKNARGIAGDFKNSVLGDIFTHGDRDDLLNREESGITPSMNVYYKNRFGDRDQWAITGVDRDFFPTVMGPSSYNTGASGGYRTRSSRVIPGVGSSIISTIVRDVNDEALPPDPSDENVDDASVDDTNINDTPAPFEGGPLQPVFDFQDPFDLTNPEEETILSNQQSAPYNAPPAWSPGIDYGGNPLSVFTDPAEEAPNLNQPDVVNSEAIQEEGQALDEGSAVPQMTQEEFDALSLAEQIKYAGDQAQARGEKSLQLTPGNASGEMPEENEKIVEEYEAKQEAARRAAEPLNKWKRENKDKLDYIYNSFHTATGSDLAKYARDYSSYADMIKMLLDHPDAQGIMEYQYMAEKYKNASAAEKAELEKKFKRAKELPAKNEAKRKEESSAAKKKAFSEEAAVEYFKARNKDFVKNPSKFKIKKVGEGVYSLDGVDGGSFGRYSARENMSFGGSVSPELYEFVYGGDEMDDPDAYKNLQDPYFAPGGAFNKPKLTKEQKKLAKNAKMDPVLGPMSPTQAVEDHRNNPDLISKGVVGQMTDHLKTRFPIKKTFNALKDSIFKKDFTWASKEGDDNGAYAYIGADGYNNAFTSAYDADMQGKTGQYEGAALNIDVNEKVLGPDKMTVYTSPYDKDGNYLGIINRDKGTYYEDVERPKAGYIKNSLGGLNKFVTAGEVEPDFFNQQNAPNENVVEYKQEEEEFNIEDCTAEDFADPKSKCYEMSRKQEELNLNDAYSVPGKFLSAIGDFTATKLQDANVVNTNRLAANKEFMDTSTSDSMAASVATGTRGANKLTGDDVEDSVVGLYTDPVKGTSPKAYKQNFTSYGQIGGQYKAGGVYDMSAADIDRLLAQGAKIEIIQ